MTRNKKPTAKKTATKKTPAKKAVAKKVPVKKAVAKKVPTKKVADKKSASKQNVVANNSCSCARFVFATLSAFIFIFLFEFLWHGSVLNDLYLQTISLWRSPDEMTEFSQIVILNQLILAFLIAFIFTRKYESRGLLEGARFGFYAGLIMGFMNFSFYPYIPIPFDLAFLWLVGGVLEGFGIGVVLSLTYRSATN